MTRAPIAIGAVGGSGTRVIAAIMRDAGIDIGRDLNRSLDNLWFTLLFKQREICDITDAEFIRRVSIFQAAMTGDRPFMTEDYSIVSQLAAKDRIHHPASWLRERADNLLFEIDSAKEARTWGWKEPNTHIVVNRLASAIPGLRYVHVARNGLDMAFSRNQNQLQLWGDLALGGDLAMTPRHSLKYWCWVHRRILHIGKALKSRFLFLRFEDLCRNPEAEIRTLLSFASVPPDADLVRRSVDMIVPPASIGRHKNHPLDAFDTDDIEFVRQLGFEVGP